MTNKDVLMAELSALDDDRLFGVFCNLHNDYCDGCSFNGMHCPVSSSPKFVSSSGWMNRPYPCKNEKITYQVITCDECITPKRGECIWHNAGATYCSFGER